MDGEPWEVPSMRGVQAALLLTIICGTRRIRVSTGTAKLTPLLLPCTGDQKIMLLGEG